MRQSRFSDEQIIGMIKEQEAGMPTTEVCHKHGISTASFYKYKAKFITQKDRIHHSPMSGQSLKD